MPDCRSQRCGAARGNSNLGAYHRPEEEVLMFDDANISNVTDAIARAFARP